MGRLRFFGQEEVDIRLRNDRGGPPRRLVPWCGRVRCAGWVCGECADCAAAVSPSDPRGQGLRVFIARRLGAW